MLPEIGVRLFLWPSFRPLGLVLDRESIKDGRTDSRNYRTDRKDYHIERTHGIAERFWRKIGNRISVHWARWAIAHTAHTKRTARKISHEKPHRTSDPDSGRKKQRIQKILKKTDKVGKNVPKPGNNAQKPQNRQKNPHSKI